MCPSNLYLVIFWWIYIKLEGRKCPDTCDTGDTAKVNIVTGLGKGGDVPIAAAPPICLSLATSKRQLAGAFGFQGLLAFDVHLDLLGFGFRLLREADLQHALVIVGAYLLRIHRVGQCERTGEASVLSLDSLEILLFFFLLEPTLAADGERVVYDAMNFC